MWLPIFALLALAGAAALGSRPNPLKAEWDRASRLDEAEVVEIRNLLAQGTAGDLDKFARWAANLRQAGFPLIASQLEHRAATIRAQQNIVTLPAHRR